MSKEYRRELKALEKTQTKLERARQKLDAKTMRELESFEKYVPRERARLIRQGKAAVSQVAREAIAVSRRIAILEGKLS